jgi:hypothetical protein
MSKKRRPTPVVEAPPQLVKPRYVPDLAEEAAHSAAFKKAQEIFGNGGVVGRNFQHPGASFHVGQKHMGDWILFGKGASWDEAFADVKEIPPHGKPF